jgi:hypothetical protein
MEHECMAARTPHSDEIRPEETMPHPGCLPAWGMAEMPAPPPFRPKTAMKVIGAGAIALGMSIGSGEWLLGPAVTAKYGAALLWVATVSIVLQAILNQEMVRYTLATGEPIFTGFLRTKPGSGFWGPFYSVLMFLQLGWPGWALAGATALVTMQKGSMTTDADKPAIILVGTITFLVCLAIIAFGSKVEKTLEKAEWFMIAWILGFMILVGLFCVTPATWFKVFGGFLGGWFGTQGNPIPENKDWVLLASFAAYAGMGGLGNGAITNWVRDKGWGMAATSGFIPGMIGGKEVHLSRVGNMFPRTAENMARFREWLRYVRFEQWIVFALGCFLGMGLPALMTVQFVPAGTDLQGWAAASYQAEGIRKIFGNLAWTLTLLNGFWILFSTQLGNTDAFARTVTDMAWSSHPKLRTLVKDDVRKVYYAVLGAFLLFGIWAIHLTQPFALIVIGAFIAAFNFVVLGTHVLYVQKRFLPKELRMPLSREICLYIFVLLFIAFTFLGVQSKWGEIIHAIGLG